MQPITIFLAFQWVRHTARSSIMEFKIELCCAAVVRAKRWPGAIRSRWLSTTCVSLWLPSTHGFGFSINICLLTLVLAFSLSSWLGGDGADYGLTSCCPDPGKAEHTVVEVSVGKHISQTVIVMVLLWVEFQELLHAEVIKSEWVAGVRLLLRSVHLDA